jgi:hypothetical protein
MGSQLSHQLIMTDVRLLLARAAENRETIRARLFARRMLARYPSCGMTEDQLTATIRSLATERHLAVDTSSQ